MRRGRVWLVLAGIAGSLMFAPRAAHAQWYAGSTFGGNHTQSASVTIDQSSTGTALVYHDVDFKALPFKAPQYYSWQLGRMLGHERRFGLEFEFTHLKVIGITNRVYHATGTLQGAPIDDSVAMDDFVQQYQMTHGLNFLLANFVARFPIGGGRASLVARAGGGATLPHAETVVNNEGRDQYQFAGPGAGTSMGVVLRVVGALSIVGEYKLTIARPRISIAGGTGQMWAVTHQAATGFVVGF